MKWIALTLIAGIAACDTDETLRSYGAADKTWVLTEIDGTAFTARTTMTFPEKGRIAGKAPCNSYGGTMSVPYPWFKVGPLRSTKMACSELQAETRFFRALSDMSLSEVAGDTLILSTPEGRQMIFKAGE
jgi:heat shock protein HslJ